MQPSYYNKHLIINKIIKLRESFDVVKTNQ